MGKPVVTVIMNIRNGQEYLREAIDSVLAQSFADWELIAWDNRSTDNSAQIVASYLDPRIRYHLSPETVSLGRARELAMSLAAGEWIAFLDHDDIWLPEKLEKQLALGREDPATGFVYGRTLTFSAGGALRDFDHRHEFAALPEGMIFERLFVDSCYLAISSVLFRRSAVDDVRPIPDGIDMCPDYYLYLEIARRRPVRAVQEVVCRYRLHASNMTHHSTKKTHEECLWLIHRWAKALDPHLAARRRRVHHSLIAVEELRYTATRSQGLARLIRNGSAAYVLSRPLARSWRALRRRIFRPNWMKVERTAGGRGAILGTRVNVSTFVEAQVAVGRLVESGGGSFVSPATVYSVMLAYEDPAYKRIVDQAAIVNADGMPLVWALRSSGYKAERVHHDDLFMACCERYPEWRHFLLGGRTGQAELVATEMRRRFPGIQIVGTHHTPVRPVPDRETETILAEIRAARPTVVWVGMGTPAQDHWMAAAAPLAGLTMVGVGSVFDLLAGRTRPAPDWMKRSGLQWLFRLCLEPKRLARRYLRYNTRFAIAIAMQYARRGCREQARP